MSTLPDRAVVPRAESSQAGSGVAGGRPSGEPRTMRRMPSLDRRELAAIFVGGCLGALARAGVGQLSAGGALGWPWTTFAVNVAGCFLLGYFTTRLQERLPLSSYRRPFVGTGFCGALTTFATFQVELLRMIDAHRYGMAAGYAAASIAAGYAAVTVATAVVRRVRQLA